MSVRIKEVTLTSAQVLALGTTPVELIPAPASGYANVYLSCTMKLNYNTTAYVCAGVLNVYTVQNGTSYLWTDSTMFKQTVIIEQSLSKAVTAMLPPTSRLSLNIAATAAITVGNSTITFRLAYQTILIDT